MRSASPCLSLRLAALGSAWALAACAGTPGTLRPTRPTPLVRISGAVTELLGEELARDALGNVEIDLHDGRRIWVTGSRVQASPLAVGERVVLRWDATAALYTAQIIELAGDLLRVRWDSDASETLVSPRAALAVAKALPMPAAASPSTNAPTPAPQPETSRARAVVLETQVGWKMGRAVRCDHGVTVLFGDGSSATVEEANLRAVSGLVELEVAARWNDGALHYFGRVERLKGTEAEVRYEDGSLESLPIDRVSYAFGQISGQPLNGLCAQLRGTRVVPVLVQRFQVEHAARVESCTAATLTVRRPSAAQAENVAREAAPELALSVGDWIAIRWGANLYLASVQSIEGPSVGIKYEDGTVETRAISEIQLRLVAPDRGKLSAEPSPCP